MMRLPAVRLLCAQEGRDCADLCGFEWVLWNADFFDDYDLIERGLR